MKMRKLALNLLLITTVFSLASCRSTSAKESEDNQVPVEQNSNTNDTTNQSQGDITFATRDYQLDSKYQELARIYEDETGVKINFQTVDNNMSDDDYFGSFEGDNAPTIFELRGYSDYDSLKGYTKDLTNLDLYSNLNENTRVLQDDSNMGVYGIPQTVEGHGILYNKAILDKYFALEGTTFNSIEEITDYSSFSRLVEDMTARKEELQIEGVFSATSLKEGEDGRFYNNLANIPIYHEVKKSQVDINGYYEDDINLDYHENFNNVYDLYLNNSTTDRDMLYTVSEEDSMREFALGQSAMVQGSSTSYRYIDGVEGRMVEDSDIKMLPIYTGIMGEENYSIQVGSDSFLAINKNATDEEQMMAEDFINWLHTSTTGKDYVTNQLGYDTPFTSYTDEQRVNDPISSSVRAYQNDTSRATIPFYYNHVKDTSYSDRLRGAVDNMGDNLRMMGDDMADDMRNIGDDISSGERDLVSKVNDLGDGSTSLNNDIINE